MQIEEPEQPIRIEPRWPAILAILVLLMVHTLLPSRIRMLPFWFPYIIVSILLLPLTGVWLSRGHQWWLRVERTITFIFSVIAEVLTITTLSYLNIGNDGQAG